MRIVFWGTYDTGKPRVRILLRGLRENGVEVIECHREVWTGVEDKSQVKGVFNLLRFGLRWLFAYPALIWRYLRLPSHDAVVIGYLGQLDVLVLWPFARLRGVPVVWDAFISLYDTVVEDRKMVGRGHPLARLLHLWEWLACRAASLVVLDTGSHGRYFSETFGIPESKVASVFVGAETDVFHPPAAGAETARESRAFTVLFYGQFIPLHGIEAVVRAAKLTEGENVHWHIIGTGQETPRIKALIDELKPARLTWDEWVPYPELIRRIHGADVCLGIFGASEKASRVIPNKVFQALASGCPIITRDSPAMRELPGVEGAISLVPANDPGALADTVRAMKADYNRSRAVECAHRLIPRISPRGIGLSMLDAISRLGPRLQPQQQ